MSQTAQTLEQLRLTVQGLSLSLKRAHNEITHIREDVWAYRQDLQLLKDILTRLDRKERTVEEVHARIERGDSPT